MSDPIDIDPTKPEEQGAAGGALGGGDENPQDYSLPGGPTEAPDKRKQRCTGIARSWVRIPFKPEFFSGYFFNCLS